MCQVVSYPTSAFGNMISSKVLEINESNCRKHCEREARKIAYLLWCTVNWYLQTTVNFHAVDMSHFGTSIVIVYPSRSHSPVAGVAFLSPLGPGNFRANYFRGQPWMAGKDSSASNVVSYLTAKVWRNGSFRCILVWSTWWCQEPPLNQSPSLGWWLIAPWLLESWGWRGM